MGQIMIPQQRRIFRRSGHSSYDSLERIELRGHGSKGVPRLTNGGLSSKCWVCTVQALYMLPIYSHE